MHPWSPLNDRQLALLTRIGDGTDPVTSDNPELALTARALKERRLIAMPKQGGKWRAEITDAGRFYLEHGHHPDRPEPAQRKQRLAGSEQRARATPSPQKQAAAPSTMKPAPQRAAKPPQPSPAEVGAALIAEVQQAGRFLRIPNPSDEERARYRRAFDAARQCAPDGYHLKYSGRAKGDFFLGLLRVTGEDDTEWNRIRLARSRVITDVEDVLAAVTADHSAFEISEEVLPRVLALLRLLAEQALARYGEIAVSKKRKQPRPLLTVHGRTYEVSFRERQKPVRYVPKQPARRTYDWQRVTPAQKFEPSSELELLVSQQSGYSYGWKKEWADTAKKPLEEQIGSVFRALKARAEEQERARLEREAEQQRLREERERQEAERRRLEAERKEREQREWEAAVSVASIKAVHAVRAEHFGTALERWQAAGEIRTFCAALDEAAATSENALEAERLREWSAWGKTEADRLDPTLSGKGLASLNFHAEPTGDQLRPFLDGWHPHRPEKEKTPATQPTPPKPESDPWRGIIDAHRDQGWRYGRQGRAQWWRR
ncbi:PE-PGRS family protein [Streptomyces ipomoeae]|uniref:PE-PGRS family protein n=1 Tax=Streptomyces ipomoeae TaxID=103232 RepID=UPI0011465D29|nr:PE-PGRS family protein [Streptomyces ipomoeae]MDX2936374.1 PE-PGRS family protein [Streptomyces ipomoeae]TQE24470.1 PE-PGRS family protein [Streptomyces ipomoeae]